MDSEILEQAASLDERRKRRANVLIVMVLIKKRVFNFFRIFSHVSDK
jgi:hypothetical protein